MINCNFHGSVIIKKIKVSCAGYTAMELPHQFAHLVPPIGELGCVHSFIIFLFINIQVK